MVYPNGTVGIPLTAVGTGTSANFVTQGLITVDGGGVMDSQDDDQIGVTFKNGSYQFVNSVNCKINGVTIQNSQDMHLHNHIRTLTKWSENYAETHGQLHLFAKDDDDANTLDQNSGFSERVEMVNYKYVITQAGANGVCTLTVSCEARIAFSLMSDFFDRMAIPIKNANVELFITLNGLKNGPGAGQNWSPIAINDKVKAALANGSVSMSYTIGANGIDNTCKLYVPKVTFTPEDALELAPLLEAEAGMERSVIWDDAQVAINRNAYNSSKLDDLIANSVRRPIKVWSMFFPKPANVSQLKDQQLPYPAITAPGIKTSFCSSCQSRGVEIC
jgi:hypothetical protein